MALNRLWLPLLMLILSACQSTYVHSPFALPSNATGISATYKHLAIYRGGNTQRLHVYIEGDGIPFENRFVIAKDPTPLNPLMLQLMSLDKGSRLYLGRPCYYSRSMEALKDDHCQPDLWTHARYSKDVVDSMVSALRIHLREHPAKGVTLIGHSGGGSLAMLMAARMHEVDQVVTLAGNLDTRSWTQLHHFTPLKDSLNPADLSVLQLPRHQLHVAGGKDTNIPPELAQAVLSRMGLNLHIFKDADHNCCWEKHWPDLLQRMQQQITNQ